MFSKIKITECQFYVCVTDVPNGQKFLVTKFFVYISTFLKSLQMSIFNQADNSHSRYLFILFFYLTNGLVTWIAAHTVNSQKRPKYKQQKKTIASSRFH